MNKRLVANELIKIAKMLLADKKLSPEAEQFLIAYRFMKLTAVESLCESKENLPLQMNF